MATTPRPESVEAVKQLRARYQRLVREHKGIRGALTEAQYLAANLPSMLGGRRMRNPRRRHSKKWDRCVAEVSAKGRAVDPYAVCNKALKRRKRKRNPRVYVLVASKGRDRLRYVGAGKFSKRGRGKKFSSPRDALVHGEVLQSIYPVLRKFKLSTEPPT